MKQMWIVDLSQSLKQQKNTGVQFCNNSLWAFLIQEYLGVYTLLGEYFLIRVRWIIKGVSY